jgi:hypothetical protein
MYKIDISVRCPDGLNEVLANEPEMIACIVESSLSVALVELFGHVIVDDVHIEYTSSEDERGEIPPCAA